MPIRFRQTYIFFPPPFMRWILLPKLARYDAMNLEDMVREVNTDGVSREEVLSDKVYIYRRSDGFITMSF